MVIGLGLASFSLPFHKLVDHLLECLILRNKQIKHFSKILQKGVLLFLTTFSFFLPLPFASHCGGWV